MSSLVDKIIICHQTLAAANIPHAFGGALALAWCTQAARGTIDIDINLFVDAHQAEQVLRNLPKGVSYTKADLKTLIRDTQIRLFWQATPLDLFLNSTPYHIEVQSRIRFEDFAGHKVPFLSCGDVAVFKAFFNSTKDWADLEEMQIAGTLDWRFVVGVLTEYLGADDERIHQLRMIAQRPSDTRST
ncbi:MAG: hypothetical protein GXP16_18905 [Gammaproteobacteria bacterium]|nr:hypothetical protein [Gammaproteobacteria bacterium]